MILYGKPVADALREQYAERIEKMARWRRLDIIIDGTEDKKFLSAIEAEAAKWKVKLAYENDPVGKNFGSDRIIDVRKKPDNNVGLYTVDGQSAYGKYKVYCGQTCDDTPCTAEAIIRILDYYDIPITGKHAVVIGRSERVGKPTAMLLLARDATVTVCHSRTSRGIIHNLVVGADIVVCASGQKRLLDRECIPFGCTVINVGGDYIGEHDECINLIPFKGGVGPVTTAVLMSHVVM